LGGEGDKRKERSGLVKKSSLFNHRGPNHGLHRLESLGYRPGTKALAVETRVLAQYRGQVRGIARTGNIYDPISTKKMLSELQAMAKPVFGVILKAGKDLNLPKKRDFSRRSE
jgi:hypothetical protein